MIRKKVSEEGFGKDKNFNWRGGEVSRVEGLSDAVFAFAVTLLVVSLEVPKTFNDLIIVMKGFFAFGICFTFLIWIWYNHYIFFRRYGFNNIYIIVLNSILLFLVLFYIYPLKFLFTMLINQMTNEGGIEATNSIIHINDTPLLMIIYSLGFFAVFSIFLLMYLYAYKKRKNLNLNEYEIFYTKFNIEAYIIYLSVAFASILMAAIGGINFAFWAGIIYALIGPLRTFHALINRKKINKILLIESS